MRDTTNKEVNYFFECYIIMFLLLSGASCTPRINAVVVSEREIVINSEGITIPCIPSLRRQNRSASILLEIDGHWSVAPPWKGIEFSDGRKVVINAVATMSNKQKIQSSIIGGTYGKDGSRVNIRFEPEIPKNLSVDEIFITASSKIVCRKIIWYDYDSE